MLHTALNLILRISKTSNSSYKRAVSKDTSIFFSLFLRERPQIDALQNISLSGKIRISVFSQVIATSKLFNSLFKETSDSTQTWCIEFNLITTTFGTLNKGPL